MTEKPLKVIIVGGGVGGLTAAIALRQAGFDATVYEKTANLSRVQVGGGIHLWTNAMRALQQIGVADAVMAVGTPSERQEFRSWHGRELVDWPIGDLGRQLGAPTLGVSRADIHPVLVRSLDADALVTGAECTGFSQDPSGVTVRFADGREERGDVLIGADGIRSAVRAQLLGASEPRYAGYTIWQAILDFEDENVPIGVFRMLWGPGRKFTFYHVGGERLYWFAIANAAAGGTDTDRNRLVEMYQGFMAPTQAIIAATDQQAITRADHYDRKPVTRWGEGRVTLLGDAAHPMTLNLGQGACMAIEDGVVLTKCLERASDPAAALRAYENQRMKRTSSMVNLAWRLGSMGKWTNPMACAARDQFMHLAFSRIGWQQHSKSLAFQA